MLMDVWRYSEEKHWGTVFLYDAELTLVETRSLLLSAPDAELSRMRVKGPHPSTWTSESGPNFPAGELSCWTERFALVASAREDDGHWSAIYAVRRGQ